MSHPPRTSQFFFIIQDVCNTNFNHDGRQLMLPIERKKMSQRVSLHFPGVPYLLPLSMPSLVLALTDSTAGGLPLRPGGARFIIPCRGGQAMLSNRTFYRCSQRPASDSCQPVYADHADLESYHFFLFLSHPTHHLSILSPYIKLKLE